MNLLLLAVIGGPSPTPPHLFHNQLVSFWCLSVSVVPTGFLQVLLQELLIFLPIASAVLALVLFLPMQFGAVQLLY